MFIEIRGFMFRYKYFFSGWGEKITSELNNEILHRHFFFFVTHTACHFASDFWIFPCDSYNL